MYEKIISCSRWFKRCSLNKHFQNKTRLIKWCIKHKNAAHIYIVFVTEFDWTKKDIQTISSCGFKYIYFNYDETEGSYFRGSLTEYLELRKSAILNYTYSYTEVEKYGWKYLHFPADSKHSLRQRKSFKKYDIGACMSLAAHEEDRLFKLFHLKEVLENNNIKNWIGVRLGPESWNPCENIISSF